MVVIQSFQVGISTLLPESYRVRSQTRPSSPTSPNPLSPSNAPSPPSTIHRRLLLRSLPQATSSPPSTRCRSGLSADLHPAPATSPPSHRLRASPASSSRLRPRGRRRALPNPRAPPAPSDIRLPADTSTGSLVLYDVRGRRGELATPATDRPQIRTPGGCVGVEVFPGNTSDPKTLTAQVQQVQRRFGTQASSGGDRGITSDPRGLRASGALRADQIKTSSALPLRPARAPGKSSLFPGERLDTPAPQSARKREALLNTTDRSRTAPKGQPGPSGKPKPSPWNPRPAQDGKHFLTDIEQGHFSFQRNQDSIAREAARRLLCHPHQSAPTPSVRASRCIPPSLKSEPPPPSPLPRPRPSSSACSPLSWHLRRDLGPSDDHIPAPKGKAAHRTRLPPPDHLLERQERSTASEPPRSPSTAAPSPPITPPKPSACPDRSERTSRVANLQPNQRLRLG